jgi:hypothetical protein
MNLVQNTNFFDKKHFLIENFHTRLRRGWFHQGGTEAQSFTEKSFKTPEHINSRLKQSFVVGLRPSGIFENNQRLEAKKNLCESLCFCAPAGLW